MLAFEPEAVQPRAKPVEVELVQWLELAVEVLRQCFLIGGDEL